MVFYISLFIILFFSFCTVLSALRCRASENSFGIFKLFLIKHMLYIFIIDFTAHEYVGMVYNSDRLVEGGNNNLLVWLIISSGHATISTQSMTNEYNDTDKQEITSFLYINLKDNRTGKITTYE